jgi:hypothetical protein
MAGVRSSNLLRPILFIFPLIVLISRTPFSRIVQVRAPGGIASNSSHSETKTPNISSPTPQSSRVSKQKTASSGPPTSDVKQKIPISSGGTPPLSGGGGVGVTSSSSITTSSCTSIGMAVGTATLVSSSSAVSSPKSPRLSWPTSCSWLESSAAVLVAS